MTVTKSPGFSPRAESSDAKTRRPLNPAPTVASTRSSLPVAVNPAPEISREATTGSGISAPVASIRSPNCAVETRKETSRFSGSTSSPSFSVLATSPPATTLTVESTPSKPARSSVSASRLSASAMASFWVSIVIRARSTRASPCATAWRLETRLWLAVDSALRSPFHLRAAR